MKVNLRQLGEPICKEKSIESVLRRDPSVSLFSSGLFGEGPAERRERLRNIISRLSEDEIAQKLKKKEDDERKTDTNKEVRSISSLFRSSDASF